MSRGDQTAGRGGLRESRALRIALAAVVLGLLLVARCDTLLWVAPGAKHLRFTREVCDGAPTIRGLPTDTCSVFVIIGRSGFRTEVLEGERVDMCAGAVEPASLSGEILRGLEYGPGVTFDPPRTARSLVGFTYPRPVIGILGGLMPALPPGVGWRTIHCGLVAVHAVDRSTCRTLAWEFVWNSPEDQPRLSARATPSWKQYGLVAPTPEGWGVWIWPRGGPWREFVARGIVRGL